MSHDIEAYYAASELASQFDNEQKSLLKVYKRTGKWLVTASRSKDKDWPYADAMITAGNGSASHDVKIAIEYKKQSEGIHGILTALGQAYSYLAKGYEAVVLVIPNVYTGYSNPADKLKEFIDTANKNSPIGIYSYDPSKIGVGMFVGNLKNERPLTIKSRKISTLKSGKTSDTIWAHFREGSSEYGDIYSYCLAANTVNESEPEDLSKYKIPKELKEAVERIAPGANPHLYLSNSTADISRKNRVWRYMWYNLIFHQDVMPLYKKKSGIYVVNDTKTKIPTKNCTDFRHFFSYNQGSIKQRKVKELNDGKITEELAWNEYAKNINDRAHSYRIDVEAAAYGIDMVDENAELTLLGNRYVRSCKTSNPFDGETKRIFDSAYLNNGNYNAFLQFFYQVSEEFLSVDNLKWAKEIKDKSGNVVSYKFDQTKYREDIEDEFKNNLHIIRKVSPRKGKKRPALKAEISALTMMGLVGDYRVSTGLPINWVEVNSLNEYYVSHKLYE